MGYRKIITLSLFNRPKYTINVLKHLAKCKGIADYNIVPVIDYMPNSNNQEVMTEILRAFANQGLKVDVPRYHEHNVGCNANIFTCLNIGFMFTDFLIHIEDDILLAPDALQFFEWAADKYRQDKDVFTVDAYNNEDFSATYDPSINFQVCRSQSFKPWGWSTWIDRWNEIKDDWQFEFGPKKFMGRQFEGGGWDVCMKKLFRGDRYRVYPKLARCVNIGAEMGAHTPSPEFHHKKHDVDVWAGNTEVGDGQFAESNTR